MPTSSPNHRSKGHDLPPIRLDPSIRNQALRLHDALRRTILDGLIAPGSPLPSSRALANGFGIGRNMVVAAYEHLAADGLIETRPGAGTFVATDLPPAPPPPQALPEPPEIPSAAPFALGMTEVDPGLLTRLAAATRRHIAEAKPADLGYGDPRGSARLRTAVAEFVALHRGIRCDPQAVVITLGTQHGLRLVGDALLRPGDPVWMEDPGYHAAKVTLGAIGARLVPVPIDAEGIDVATGRARAPQARAAYVTPSHQFPTGVSLSMARRGALADWARQADAWIFEDDYDSEFRYSGPPLTALAGLSPDRVIYSGTFAKTLFPGLRLGYLVLPPDALGPVLNARAALDRFPPVFAQEALADLMADGTLATHLRRMRRSYHGARDLLAATLRERSGGLLIPEPPEQGLHMPVRLAPALRGRGADLRDRAGICARLLSEERLEPGGPEALILGFSGHPPDAIRAAATRLAQAARDLAG